MNHKFAVPLGLCLVMLFTNCAPASAIDDHAAVMPERAAKGLTNLCSRDSPHFEGTWTPSAADIQKMETKFDLLAQQSPVQGTEVSIHATQYYRQYFGLVIAGKRVIYINAFPHPQASWRKQAANICDGGAGFWGALYDPATGRFSELRTNGNA